MDKAEKAQIIAMLKEAFTGRGGVILLSFHGIKVPDITELRRQVRRSGGNYRVVKNTLAIRALEGTSAEPLKDRFTGPTAVAYADEDPVALAKVLKEFMKNHPGLGFKAGVLEGTVLDEKGVESLSDLASREELLAKLLFLLNAPLQRLARGLQSPLQNLVFALDQLAKQRAS
ncbi:MAG TPA: 50S ribosomal protein L10 [Acidobacteriota bacterium]|jgi:large subunit ribosomal protein L10|nr:50S ribosomal protein L10 [Acidobacteriota bacterium]HRR25941.1 50S ribosomal protein L10 [Acidobacteriota bacterium]HRR56657.1 50S ribosomal protein L10 [Acidobacteriota bacterium]HRV09018.1 50S ribosomal protein L10 [Acidobacteriota bacterium]